jgi:hypothetical protein
VDHPPSPTVLFKIREARDSWDFGDIRVSAHELKVTQAQRTDCWPFSQDKWRNADQPTGCVSHDTDAQLVADTDAHFAQMHPPCH